MSATNGSVLGELIQMHEAEKRTAAVAIARPQLTVFQAVQDHHVKQELQRLRAKNVALELAIARLTKEVSDAA